MTVWSHVNGQPASGPYALGVPSFSTHVVVAIEVARDGLQRVRLDSGRRAYVLTQLIGPVAVGDPVVVNTTAVDLGLGTGGWDVVHWNLARDAWSQPGPGHVMKLRYTSLQADTGSAEELGPYYPPISLATSPVVACALHSQVACVAAVFRHLAPTRRLVYVMTDGGALPIAISDLVGGMRDAGLVAATVTCGHAFGGDFEAVNVYSGIETAFAMTGADAVVAGIGPGAVGTGTTIGHSGVDVATIVNATIGQNGRAIVSVRYSDADERFRHRGVSHHTVSALALARPGAIVPVPRGEPRFVAEGHDVVEVDVPDVRALLEAAGLEVTTMGRGPADDPGFFAYAGAAGAAAAALLA